MAVAAAVKFVQGATIGTPGQALFGTFGGGLVVVSNGDNTNVVRWRFEVLGVPTGSAVALGLAQDGAVPTWSFTPDLRGGYLVRLTVFSLGNAESDADARVFGIQQVSGRFIPPFTPREEPGDEVLNFAASTRGWFLFMEQWLLHLETLAAPYQHASAKVTVDTTTVSLVYVDLLTVNFNKALASSRLVIRFTASASNTAVAGVLFFILVDGAPQLGGGTQAVSIFGGVPSAAVVSLDEPGFAAGARQIKVVWAVTGGTGQIRPVGAPGQESGILTVEEWAA